MVMAHPYIGPKKRYTLPAASTRFDLGGRVVLGEIPPRILAGADGPEGHEPALTKFMPGLMTIRPGT